jgi:Secretion system C-terminal sorting domain
LNSLSNHATYVIPVDNFVVLNNASVVLQATKNGAQISTTWQAINQQQIQSYLIQHSTDNAVFTTAATLTANASNPDYAFLIANIIEAVYYVRIKIISVNGLVSYSNTVKVGGNFSAIVKSVVAPNPSNGVTNLQITLANSQMVNYKVTNSLGQVIFVYNTKLNAGFNSVPLNCLQKVQAGTYFVTFNLGQQTVTHKLQILNK